MVRLCSTDIFKPIIFESFGELRSINSFTNAVHMRTHFYPVDHYYTSHSETDSFFFFSSSEIMSTVSVG